MSTATPGQRDCNYVRRISFTSHHGGLWLHEEVLPGFTVVLDIWDLQEQRKDLVSNSIHVHSAKIHAAMWESRAMSMHAKVVTNEMK